MPVFTADGNHLEIQQGATFTLSLNLLNADSSQRNLSSGFTAAMQGRATHKSSGTIFSLTSSSGIALQATSPNIVVTLTAAQTAALHAPLRGVYDLELTTTSSGVVERVIEGTFETTPEVTR